jgi:hypothetical protein
MPQARDLDGACKSQAAVHWRHSNGLILVNKGIGHRDPRIGQLHVVAALRFKRQADTERLQQFAGKGAGGHNHALRTVVTKITPQPKSSAIRLQLHDSPLQDAAAFTFEPGGQRSSQAQRVHCVCVPREAYAAAHVASQARHHRPDLCRAQAFVHHALLPAQFVHEPVGPGSAVAG